MSVHKYVYLDGPSYVHSCVYACVHSCVYLCRIRAVGAFPHLSGYAPLHARPPDSTLPRLRLGCLRVSLSLIWTVLRSALPTTHNRPAHATLVIRPAGRPRRPRRRGALWPHCGDVLPRSPPLGPEAGRCVRACSAAQRWNGVRVACITTSLAF